LPATIAIASAAVNSNNKTTNTAKKDAGRYSKKGCVIAFERGILTQSKPKLLSFSAGAHCL
jgi:hypothetical protein